MSTAATGPKKRATKKVVKKNIATGIAHIKSTFRSDGGSAPGPREGNR